MVSRLSGLGSRPSWGHIVLCSSKGKILITLTVCLSSHEYKGVLAN